MRTNLLLGFILLCPIASWAQSLDVKPGLWDFTTTVQMGGMPAIPNLDQMPPEQRARIEAAMKGMSGTPTTVKSCVTKDSFEKSLANSQKNSTCTTKVVNSSSSKIEVHMECSPQGSDAKSTGDITVERQDSEHFKGNGVMKSTSPAGRSTEMKWSMTGAFVSPDCGNVKPAGTK